MNYNPVLCLLTIILAKIMTTMSTIPGDVLLKIQTDLTAQPITFCAMSNLDNEMTHL